MPLPKPAGNSPASNSDCGPISSAIVSTPSRTKGAARVCRASLPQRGRSFPRPPARPRTPGSLPWSWPRREGPPRVLYRDIRDRLPPFITRQKWSPRRRLRTKRTTTMPSIPSFRRSWNSFPSRLRHRRLRRRPAVMARAPGPSIS